MATNEIVDLDKYFERIRWGGPTAPSYAMLAGILEAHMSAIPFENVDVLLGRGIRIDVEGLQAKLVSARRGGYCYEHATLLGAVLDRLGFSPVRHLARVVMIVPRTVAARGHMFLTVPLPEGTFAVDPGFGALAPRIPVHVVDRKEASAGRETHWLEREGQYWTLKMRANDVVSDCWATTFEAENPGDFAVANHYTSTHPESAFVNRIMMRVLIPRGRVTVHNRDVTITRDGVAVASQLADRKALRELLATHFGFDLPEVEALRVPAIPEWE